MQEEAMILDRHEGVLEMDGHGGDRDVVPLLVESEPALAVGAVEPGVADAARQLIDGVALRCEPAERGGSCDEKAVEQVFGPTEVGSPGGSHRYRSILVSGLPNAVVDSALAAARRADRAFAGHAHPALPHRHRAAPRPALGRDVFVRHAEYFDGFLPRRFSGDGLLD